MLNKRGVVSITTFSLIILILLIILGFSYNHYTNSKTEINLLLKKEELLLSMGSFRSELINLATYNNTNLTYHSNLDSPEIEFILSNNSISGRTEYENQIIETNISNLGIQFCNTYTIYPAATTKLQYNGSCISKIN